MGSRPDQILLRRRFHDGKNRVVHFNSSVVFRDGTAGGLLFLPVIASQVGANDCPAHAGVGGLEQHFTSKVQGLWIVRRKDNRLGPLKEAFDIVAGPAVGIHGTWIERWNLIL